ncbi:MAG TPA: glycosyltransferase family 39 protein, partial [Pseudobdellovibrionaceae bacterium]|nr:glycosyltransferase family 39 protein [Pseudobdellovibrionaceae bacterium]
MKLAVAYFIPVFADEAYYYIWSLRPQLSYFDHPPLVSWLIALGHFFLPEGNPLSLRISFIIASFFTSLVWLRILKNQKFSTSAIESFLILLFLNPLLGPGSVVATPDVPLVLFWSLSYLAFTEIFSSKSKFALYLNYAFLGMSLGLGFCSKYHIVLFVISGLIYLCFNQNYKKLNFLGVFLTLLFGFLFSLPVLIWNMENDWASFAYQLKHGFGKINYDWRWTVNYYLGQIALMSPLVFFSLFQKRQEKNNQVFALTQVGFFTTSSFKAIVEANWPITSHLHATAHFSENAPSKKLKFTYIYWVVIYALMIVFFNTSAGQKTLRNQYRATQMDQLVALV